MPEANLAVDRGPWKGGYSDSVPPFMAKPDQLVGLQGVPYNGSRDAVIDPYTGGVGRRFGCATLNDTVVNGAEVSGLLNDKWSARCRKLFAIDSPSISDGYPTLAALYGNDTGKRGTIYINATETGATNNALKNYSLLEEFRYGAPAYTNLASTTGSSNYRMKVVPMFYDSGLGLYNRGSTDWSSVGGTYNRLRQQILCAGSRSVLQTQNWLYAPNLYGTPWRWNKRFNYDESSTSQDVRIFPTGAWSPLFPPQLDTLPTAINGSTWVEGDTFYVSVVFQFEDGSYSMPCLPRPIQGSLLTSGLGLVTVGTITATPTNKYPYLRYKNIPIGPEGTVARILLRTPKQNRTAVTDTITVSPLDLRVLGVLRNNTQTTYDDYNGDDNSLLEDNEVVRYDHVLPRRARYIGTGDQRAIVSYTLPNNAAIMVAPAGVASSYSLNVADNDNAAYTSTGYYVRITDTELQLHANNGVAPNAGVNYLGFAFATYATLQRLVDAINSTSTASACKQWVAQLAPGIDGSLSSTYLVPTFFPTVLNCTTGGVASTTVTTTTGSFANIPVGARFDAVGATAGSLVTAKVSNTQITISQPATLAAGTTGYFYSDTGDEGFVVSGLFGGYVRAFCPAMPMVVYVQNTAFPKYETPDKLSVYFTGASPGAATSGVSLAPNNFYAGNRRLPHESPRKEQARYCVGVVDIEGAAVVAYTDGIQMFANVRGANSGEDFDYRLFTINDTRGCISETSLVSGNGWAAYATGEGIVVTDKNRREFVISGDIFNPTMDTGCLASQIAISKKQSALDADTHSIPMAVMGSRLYVGFADINLNACVIHYDFSPGVEASGVEELVNPETKGSYIWSPPAFYNYLGYYGLGVTVGAMGSVTTSGGRKDYVGYNHNPGTADGCIHQINTGSTDRGESFEARAIAAPFMSQAFRSISPQRIEVLVKTASGATTDSVAFAVNQTPTFSTAAPYVRVLTDDASKTLFNRVSLNIDQGQRARTDVFWARWNGAVPNTGTRIWKMTLQYDETEN